MREDSETGWTSIHPVGREEARRALGIDRFVLQIHDVSFPSDPDEDLGRGSPYSRGAERFFEFAARLGFDAIQLGPRGMTDRGNSSPYDGTIFSRNPLDLPLARLVDAGRLTRQTLESLRAGLPNPQTDVVPYSRIFDAYQTAVAEIIERADAGDRVAAREFLAANAVWLVPDALYRVLCNEHHSRAWQDWAHTPQGAFDQRLFCPLPGEERAAADRLAALRHQHARAIEDYALIQWLLDQELHALRTRLATLGLAVYGDLQVGLSLQDNWAWRRLFLSDYRMGAPPSRTNPAGQPWGYPVFDPAQFGNPEEPGPVLQFVRARVNKVLAESDGVRIDHPHGWIDPWVYRSDDPDPFHAVQTGTRLFSSPDDPLHPLLQEHAIARPEQLDRSQAGYADQRVVALEDAQVARYSLLIDTIIEGQAACGRPNGVVACEVLSTLPYPIRRVMERHHLGRFRVTQKLKLDDPADSYRIENAEPADWIMLGTHDTPPIWQLSRDWCRGPQGQAWGAYLALFLVPEPERAAFAARVAGDAGELVHALFAAMLSSRARHVVVFVADLFGMTARYNEPGVISDRNWSLRVPREFEDAYAAGCRQETALDVERSFALAVRGA